MTLNAQRAEEEQRGIIHWLRPEYQNAARKKTETQDTLELPVKPSNKPRAFLHEHRCVKKLERFHPCC